MVSKKFTSIVYRVKKCEHCDPVGAGIYERVDCGCMFAVEVGRYDKLSTARLVAARCATSKGRGSHNAICTGDWEVETDDDGCVAAGQASR